MNILKNVLQGENLNTLIIMDAASAFCAVSSLVVSLLYHGLCLIQRKVFSYKTDLKYISLCYRGTHKSATQ
jgi:hypothetical protein